MPYNNTPIAPSSEVTGTVALPLARVKKIINTDPDISQCSNNAAFVITVATEMFLQHLVEQAYTQVKSEHATKPRRNIQYRDVANAIARVENLEFLSDVVPRTMTMKQFKQKMAKEAQSAAAAAAAAASNSSTSAAAGGGSGGLSKGQGTLDGHMNGKTVAGAQSAAAKREIAASDEGEEEDSEDEEMQDS